MNKIFKYSKKTVLFFIAISLIVSIVSCDNNESIEQSASPLLRVNEAFKYELINSGTSVWIKWKIPDGYFLYRDQLKFKINDAEIRQTHPQGGYIHEAEFFGIPE
jgi:Thiol:disulfide interchange protein